MSETPAAEPVNVRILDRDYTVGVTPAERDSLVAAARLLDERMRELRGGNRVAAIERVAVLAALNLAHELQMLREQNADRDRRIDAALAGLEQRLQRLDPDE